MRSLNLCPTDVGWSGGRLLCSLKSIHSFGGAQVNANVQMFVRAINFQIYELYKIGDFSAASPHASILLFLSLDVFVCLLAFCELVNWRILRRSYIFSACSPNHHAFVSR